MASTPRLLLVTPPAFTYFPPEVFPPDAHRARLFDGLHALVAADPDVAWEPNEGVWTAPEQATAVAQRGAMVVVVAGSEHDAGGCAVLCDALRTAGVEPLGPWLRNDQDDPVGRVRAFLGGGPAAPGAPLDAPLAGGPRALWIVRFAIDTEAGRDAVRERVRREAPRHLAQVEIVLRWAALGIDPLEEMFAGNSLRDRNAELLVNILP